MYIYVPLQTKLLVIRLRCSSVALFCVILSSHLSYLDSSVVVENLHSTQNVKSCSHFFENNCSGELLYCVVVLPCKCKYFMHVGAAAMLMRWRDLHKHACSPWLCVMYMYMHSTITLVCFYIT